jgi:hypothetical protein
MDTLAPTLAHRVTAAADQLLRYSQPDNEDIVRVMELLAEVNDNLCNGRDPRCSCDAIAEMIRLLSGLVDS